MKPVTQQYVHKPEVNQYGDCQRAVIASLLELAIEEVPHFLQEAQGDPTAYWEGIQSFLRPHGYAYLVVPARSGAAFFGLDEETIYHEISGPSPRGNGVSHAVVGCNGQIAFDPHPDRSGLAGDPAEWEFAYLVKTSEPRSPAAITSPIDSRWTDIDFDKVNAELRDLRGQVGRLQAHIDRTQPVVASAQGYVEIDLPKPVQFLVEATRFKTTMLASGRVLIDNLPRELAGRWVAFVAAENDCHLKLAAPVVEAQPPDDIAVEKFAAAMKAKMAKQRAKGYSGWDDKENCPAELLQDQLVKHIAKGDAVDVGNFAMMLFNRGECTAANAVQPQAQGEAFPTIQLGFGKVEVAEGGLEGAPALIFGKNGTGVIGGATEPNRKHKQGETLAVVTFANVASLDVVLAKLGKLRADKFPDAPEATNG